jgi:flagellar biosynthesis/type III secretory pathway M-ring protein FliF/YscJ
MSTTLRLANSSNDIESSYEKNEMQNQSKNLPAYVIALIVVGCIILLGIVIYFLYRKNKQNSISKNAKTRSNAPIREVWANPGIDSINDIISWDKVKSSNIRNNCSNSSHFYGFYQKSNNPKYSNTIEFNE